MPHEVRAFVRYGAVFSALSYEDSHVLRTRRVSMEARDAARNAGARAPRRPLPSFSELARDFERFVKRNAGSYPVGNHRCRYKHKPFRYKHEKVPGSTRTPSPSEKRPD